jgi:hypothetical protein
MKVICIEPGCDGGLDDYGNRWPLCGLVYTVRDTRVDLVSGKTGFLLVEIVNKLRPTLPALQMSEVAFDRASFRPMDGPERIKASKEKVA